MTDTASPFSPRGDKAAIEGGSEFMPAFNETGLIPCVTVDVDTGTVLMVAWMNAEAVLATLRTGEAHYWSRSRRELWHKGATSGQIQKVIEMRTDCDQDTILLKVRPGGDGGACHVGYRSCFYRRLEIEDGRVAMSFHPET